MRTAWLIAVMMSAFLSVVPSATAEILVLKDGTKIHCRILKQTEKEVVVRDARGMVAIHRIEDVAEILPDVSPVEVFENVAEKTSQPGALMHYLGAYCLEHQMAHAERAFLVAAEDPWWRGRAMMGIVLSAKGNEKKRTSFQLALAADPTLASAAGAFKDLTAVDVPMEVLVELATALETLDAVDRGNYSGVAKALGEYEKKFSPEIRERASFRMKAEIGISVEEMSKRLSAAARVIRRDCDRCKSTGYITCDDCGGRDVFRKCNECDGHGYIVKTNRVTGGISPHRISVSTCRRCRGQGIIECKTCTRDTKATFREHTQTVPVMCRTCGGFTKTRCRACGGSGSIRSGISSGRSPCRTCSGTGGVPCEACRSTGGHETKKTVKVRQTASGYRVCSKCNPHRDITFPGSEMMKELSRPGGMSRDVDHVFRSEESDALRRYRRELLAQCREQDAYAWLSGRSLPVFFPAAASSGDTEEVAFAGGRWVNPDTTSVVAQQDVALGYAPRATSPGAFAAELVRLQMKDLNDSSLSLGSDAEAVWSVFMDAARLGQAGGLDQYERMKLYKIALQPGSLKFSSEGSLAIVARDDADFWPARKIILTCDGAEGGASLQLIADALANNANGASTVFFRVLDVNRQTSGDLATATETITVDVRISAATIGAAVVVEGLELLSAED